MSKIEHVFVNMQDGLGKVLAHALTEPDGGDEKRDVQLPDGRIEEGLERAASDDVRGWTPTA